MDAITYRQKCSWMLEQTNVTELVYYSQWTFLLAEHYSTWTPLLIGITATEYHKTLLPLSMDIIPLQSITAHEYHHRWKLPLQNMDTTVDERYCCRISQHMNNITDECYSYRILQHIDITTDRKLLQNVTAYGYHNRWVL